MNVIKSDRKMLLVMSVVCLIGVGLLVGAGVTYAHQTTGTKVRAKVTGCVGSDSTYGGGLDCSGTWIVGGAIVGGNGRVVVGDVDGATSSDVGHTITVRLRGGTAYTTGVGLPIILGVLGLLVSGLAGWVIIAVLTGQATRRTRAVT